MLSLLSLLALLLFSSLLAVRSADTASVTVTPSTSVSPPVPANLATFSIEVYDFVRWTDAYPNPTRPAWINLMQQLMLTPGQEGPRYRIGGNSGDLTVYDQLPLPKLPSGEALVHSTNASEVQSWAQALKAINAKAIIDVNFRRADNASWAIDFLKAVERHMGWDMVVGVEIGNEVSEASAG